MARFIPAALADAGNRRDMAYSEPAIPRFAVSAVSTAAEDEGSRFLTSKYTVAQLKGETYRRK
jgi:hypothetical protein